MKRTLSLLALIAALMPLSPLTAEGKLYTVKGVTFDPSNLADNSGIYDATKNWSTDGGLCWAATCSNIVTWWQDQQKRESLPDNVPTDNTAIWDTYRNAFYNTGGFIKQGLEWWFDGNQGDPAVGNYLYPRTETSTQGVGGYYKSKLVGGTVSSSDLVTVSAKSYGNAANFSSDLVSYIERGYGVGMSWVFKGWAGGEVGHAVTIWGVEVDDTSNIITTLYMTDSDDYATGLKAVEVTPNYYQLKGYNTLAMASDTKYNIESFTLLNSTFSNEITPPNYVDDANNVVLKYEASGGFYLNADITEVKQIQFKNDNPNLFRHLSIDHDVTAASISLQAASKNLLEVEQGGKLTVTNGISGGLDKTLTKTGDGMMLLHGDSSNSKLEILGGEVVNDGALGEVTLSDGGRLENQGTATKLTVNSGSVAEMKNNSGQQAFTQATVNDGGTLKGSGQFGKVTLEKGGTLVVGNAPVRQTYTDELIVNGGTLVFSIDDALNSYRGAADADNSGWGSGRYSTISMSNKSLTLNPDEIKINLGETILKRSAEVSDLEAALGTSFTINLENVDILMDINYNNNPLFSYYTDKAELQRLAGITTFSLSDDDGAFSIPGLQAIITPESVAYATQYGTDVMLNARLSVTLAAAPEVPEPTTGTLGLLALASLVSRRRRK